MDARIEFAVHVYHNGPTVLSQYNGSIENAKKAYDEYVNVKDSGHLKIMVGVPELFRPMLVSFLCLAVSTQYLKGSPMFAPAIPLMLNIYRRVEMLTYNS